MRILTLAIVWSLFTARFASAQLDVPPPPMPVPTGATSGEDQDGMETLTRGPIHEAFANPAEIDPQASSTVPEKPPAEVPEQPPEYQPDGNFVWLPGYWEWDDDRNGFIWVTGVWRQPPPDKRWMPGYWQEVAGGWQRVKGFWIDEQVENVTYYEAPPASLEAGPSSPQPADNYFWIPGNWTYTNTNFAWQAGYWAPYQENWVWVSARWVWTPAGYVFLPGHWDHRMSVRGQIFAPVYFTTPLYAQPGWYYRPAVVIPTNNLFIQLWIRPRAGCYYFGDYYGAQYAGLGFMPWANVGVHQRQRYFYDPFYSYASVHYRRQGVDYIGRVQGWHNYYSDHPEHRPPNTWREQQRWLATRGNGGPQITTQLTARHIVAEARQSDAPLKLKKIDDRMLREQVNHSKQLRDLDVARKNLEHEHARTISRTPDSDLPRTREHDKTGSLVDRAETGDGKKGDGKKGGETAVHHGTPMNLSLPKVDLPDSVRKATRTAGGITGTTPGTNPPPLPKVGRSTAVTQDNPINPRAGGLPGAGTGGQRTNLGQSGNNLGQKAGGLGQKTGQALDLPGDADDNRVRSRTGSNDLPGNLRPGNQLPGNQLPGNLGQGGNSSQGKGKTRGSNTGDATDVLPGRTGNLPQADLPGRSNKLPQVQPPGNSGDVPRVRSQGGQNDLQKGKSAGGGGNVPRNNNTFEGVAPRSASLPPGGGFEGAAGNSRNTQPNVRTFTPPTGGTGNNDAARGTNRGTGRDNNPANVTGGASSSNANNAKGKKKGEDK